MENIELDAGPYPRGRLGFICVANAGLTEGDMFSMRPDGVGLSFTHMRMRTECTVENLAQMDERALCELRNRRLWFALTEPLPWPRTLKPTPKKLGTRLNN